MQKSADTHVYFPQEWSQGAPKIDMFNIHALTDVEKQAHLKIVQEHSKRFRRREKFLNWIIAIYRYELQNFCHWY